MKSPTPPMGWNSYTGYSTACPEDELRKNIDALAERLLPYGYDTVVVDNGWFLDKRHDEGGRVLCDEYGRPESSRHFFPNGLKATIDYAHERGVKFGIWLIRGIDRRAVEDNLPIEGTSYWLQGIVDREKACGWNDFNYGVDMSKPGAQAYYDSMIGKYAAMGVDFIKYDDIVPHPEEVEAVVSAVEKCGRQITLSLSPGDEIQVEHSLAYVKADMVRITADIWDNRRSLDTAFGRWEAMQGYAGPETGSWLDLDMVCFGRLYLVNDGGWECKFSDAQKRTFMAQRALAASPLMLGGVLYMMDDFSMNLFTHPEILSCNQNGVIGQLVYRGDGVDVWRAHGRGEVGWVGVFNRDGERSAKAKLSRGQLGVPESITYLQDAWTGQGLAWDNGWELEIPADDVVFLRY